MSPKKIRQEINETMDNLEHEFLEDLAEGMKATRKAIAENMETFSDLNYRPVQSLQSFPG